MTSNELQERQMELTGPGRRLMDARNALNLSREEVAQELRLRVETVRAIEEDRVDELPAPMYVKGYLRNYAKILRIPAEPILESFSQLQLEAPPIISDVVKPRQKKGSTRLVRLGSIIITLVLLAGFVSWLVNQDFEPGGKGTGPVVEMETGTEEGIPVQTKDEAATGSAETLPAASNAQPDNALAEPREEIAIKQAETVAVVDNHEIVIMLKEDCWVEIVDASGNKVVFDLLRSGNIYTYKVSSAVDVFLGNASAVSMQLNNKPYDITPHIRGNLARFRIEVSKGT